MTLDGDTERRGRTAWLSHNLKVLSGVSLLQDAASELLYPVLPIFLTVTLGAPPAVVGAVEGIAEGAANVTKLASGRLGERFTKRKLIAGGYGMAALGKLVIALAAVWPLVLVGRVLDRLGKGMRGAPRDALLVDGVPLHARGRAFGFHRMADTLGAVIGPLVGLLAYELLGHRIRPLLLIAVVPALLSVALVAAVHEGRTDTARESRPHTKYRDLDLGSHYWQVVTMLTLFSVVNFADALLLLRLHDIGFSVAGVILAYVGYNLVYALASYPAGALSDRAPRPRVFGVGVLFFAIGYLGLGLTSNHAVAIVVLALYGLFSAFTDGVGKAWISSLVPHDKQLGAQGLFQGMTGLGILTAGIWAGLAWGGDGHLPLVISGSVALVVATVLIAGRLPSSVDGPPARPIRT